MCCMEIHSPFSLCCCKTPPYNPWTIHTGYDIRYWLLVLSHAYREFSTCSDTNHIMHPYVHIFTATLTFKWHHIPSFLDRGARLPGEINNLSHHMWLPVYSHQTWISVNYKALIVKLFLFSCNAEALPLFRVVFMCHSHTGGPLSFQRLYLALTQCKLSSSAQHLGGLRGCGINNLSEGFCLICLPPQWGDDCTRVDSLFWVS